MVASDVGEDELQLTEALDERADHIPVEELLDGTATADFFDDVHRSLISRGTKLLVGPRGCGKTHMMRFTWLLCRDDDSLPLAIYVSFNRYYRLEPLLKTRSSAVELFHSWVIARVLVALGELVLEKLPGIAHKELSALIGFEVDILQDLISKLERGIPISGPGEDILDSLSLHGLQRAVETSCDRLGRRRAVVLLDDAALTLTPEYLFEFFDIVRVMRTSRISPKASVYPATDFGPRFHAAHEADQIPVWLSIDRPDYQDLMGAISQRRLPNVDVPEAVDDVLKFAAFGVPRAYLTMLRQYSRASGSQSQVLNKVIEMHAESKIDEYRSMAIKIPRFESLIGTGERLFESFLSEIRAGQATALKKGEKQLILGIIETEFSVTPLLDRMFSLLVEAGLLFQAQTVSHGEGRIYRRYMPHVASLISARAVLAESRSSAATQLLEALRKRSSKHPLRRSVVKLLPNISLPSLKIDLPACRVCGAQRLTSQQRFCHECGSELLDDSTFARCMSLPLSAVPGLTAWQRSKVSSLDRIKTIGDLLAVQDPGSELRKIHRVGNIRASAIILMVTAFVDEFLS